MNVDYTEFSDSMKKSLNERLSILPENRFSIKNFSDPNYKLKNWIKSDTSQPTKPSHIDNAIASMNQRVKDYHDRSTPFKKTALCVGNNNSFLDPVDCTTIERVDFSDSNVFRQQAPIVRSDYSNIGPTRTIQIARRPVNISSSQMNVGQTSQLMPMTFRSGGLTINNTGQGNTTRYIQAGDINHQRRFSVQSNRTSNLSQSSSTSSGTTTIQQYHSQGPQKQQLTQSPISVPQSQQQTSTQQQYHPPVVVNSGDRGIPRIASLQYVQSKNHPTPQNVTRPPVRTMYPAGTGRKIHQMPTNRIQGSGNYIYSVQSGHPNIVKTVSTHRYITKPPSSQPQSQQSQQQTQQPQPGPHQQPPQRVPQSSGPSYILKEKLSL
uniref:ZM domain-containing protein n=1 Tax=Strongyloides venezuelensis TaxID=75913 RepID=A0A0K0G121_STRVS